ncbi:MAG TPA: hypothetical protein VL576_00045 [Candidatus Paceibacterota bacterium]|jgi:hypothetical protein|nr:hypothetical protein [Candidatus Paceibacterota bacterium]
MITALRNKFESVAMSNDINTTLRLVTRYAWISTGALFLCYSYFVGAITFSVINQQALERANRALASTMSTQERIYLQSQQNLTQDYANSIGLVKGTAVAFATAKPALAWNVGQ